MNNKEYIKQYNDFWKSIVENEDGTLNKDQVMRELSDYSMIMENCENAFCDMTNGEISKPNTEYWQVRSIFYDKFYDKEIVKDDISDMIKFCPTPDALVMELEKYFKIGENE